MALDTSIPFRALATVPLMSPQQHQENALARQMNQMQMQQMQMDMQDKQQQREQKNALAEALKGVKPGDYSALANAYAQYDPEQATRYAELGQKQLASQQEREQKQRERVKKALIYADTPESWDQQIEMLEAEGMPGVGDFRGKFSQQTRMALAAQVDPSLLKPDLKQVDLGGGVQWVDINPFTNPQIRGTRLDKTLTPEAILTDRRVRSEGAANRAVTMRGQNMTEARARSEPKGQIVQTDQGMMVVDPRTGVARPVTANGVKLSGSTANKPLTESQARDQLFGNRMNAANNIINDLEMKGVTRSSDVERTLRTAPLIGGAAGAVGKYFFASPDEQRVDQAQRDFLNAVLRKESGAVISPEEFDNAKKQYFPQIGDSEAVIKQKRQNREIAIREILASSPARQPQAQPAIKAKFLGME